jgi:hypothetical protein
MGKVRKFRRLTHSPPTPMERQGEAGLGEVTKRLNDYPMNGNL